MTTQDQQTIFTKIEKYIRDAIANNEGYFNRNVILIQSVELMGKYPVEFNSILNMIEIEGRMDMDMDDSTPSVVPSYQDDDPMGNEYDSPDEDYESYTPLQRTMSSN